jgi:hypothetical protein
MTVLGRLGDLLERLNRLVGALGGDGDRLDYVVASHGSTPKTQPPTKSRPVAI